MSTFIKSREIKVKHKNTFTAISLSSPYWTTACFCYRCCCVNCTCFLTCMYLRVDACWVIISFFPKSIYTLVKLIECTVLFHKRWHYKKILGYIVVFVHKLLIYSKEILNSICNTNSITTILYTLHFCINFVTIWYYVLICNTINKFANNRIAQSSTYIIAIISSY